MKYGVKSYWRYSIGCQHSKNTLCLHWGIYSLLTRRLNNTDEVVNDAINVAQTKGYIKEGDTIVLTAGMVGSVRSATNLMLVRTIERVLARGMGLGQREVAGHIFRIQLPLNGEEPLVGPHDIIYTERVDQSYFQLLQRAGGLITREGGLDSLGAVAAMEIGLPALIGAEGSLDELVNGVPVVLDTTNGQVTQWKRVTQIRRGGS